VFGYIAAAGIYIVCLPTTAPVNPVPPLLVARVADNPAAGEQVFFQIMRDVSADDQSGDARLLGVQLFFTTDAANDA